MFLDGVIATSLDRQVIIYVFRLCMGLAAQSANELVRRRLVQHCLGWRFWAQFSLEVQVSYQATYFFNGVHTLSFANRVHQQFIGEWWYRSLVRTSSDDVILYSRVYFMIVLPFIGLLYSYCLFCFVVFPLLAKR